MKLVAIVMALLCAAAPAAAQTPEAEAEAERLYKEGNLHFELAEWDQAIAKFRDGYKLVQLPLFLYNIAQAYRQKNDCVNARAFYKSYLRKEPTGDFAERSKKRVAEMEECITNKGGDLNDEPPDPADPIAEDPKVEDPKVEDPKIDKGPDPARPSKEIPPPHRVPDGPSTEPTPEGGTPPGRTKRGVGLLTAAVGVVLAGTGGYFTSKARAANRDVEAACEDTCTADEVAAFDAEGNAAERNAAILYVTGGVAIAAGIGVYLWGLSELDDHHRVAIVPSPGGASVVAGWRF